MTKAEIQNFIATTCIPHATVTGVNGKGEPVEDNPTEIVVALGLMRCRLPIDPPRETVEKRVQEFIDMARWINEAAITHPTGREKL